MAQGTPTASQETSTASQATIDAKPPSKEEVIRKVFSSAIWNYSVHKYIGDIVQG